MKRNPCYKFSSCPFLAMTSFGRNTQTHHLRILAPQCIYRSPSLSPTINRTLLSFLFDWGRLEWRANIALTYTHLLLSWWLRTLHWAKSFSAILYFTFPVREILGSRENRITKTGGWFSETNMQRHVFKASSPHQGTDGWSPHMSFMPILNNEYPLCVRSRPKPTETAQHTT